MTLLILYMLALVFGAGFLLDLASAMGQAGLLAFPLGVMHAIACYGAPMLTLVWLARAAEA